MAASRGQHQVPPMIVAQKWCLIKNHQAQGSWMQSIGWCNELKAFGNHLPYVFWFLVFDNVISPNFYEFKVPKNRIFQKQASTSVFRILNTQINHPCLPNVHWVSIQWVPSIQSISMMEIFSYKQLNAKKKKAILTHSSTPPPSELNIEGHARRKAAICFP